VTERTTNRTPLVLIGLGVVAFAVLLAVLSSGEIGSSSAALEDLAGEPRIEGEDLPPAGEDPFADPAVGTPAPVVEGAGFDGRPVTLAEGTPQLIGFMASWCPHCQEELPDVVEWMDSGAVPDGVEVVLVSTLLDPSAPNWPPDAWIEREGYTGPVLSDDADGSVASAYGLRGTPFWVAVDADGEVVLRMSGRVGTEVLDELARMALEG